MELIRIRFHKVEKVEVILKNYFKKFSVINQVNTIF